MMNNKSQFPISQLTRQTKESWERVLSFLPVSQASFSLCSSAHISPDDARTALNCKKKLNYILVMTWPHLNMMPPLFLIWKEKLFSTEHSRCKVRMDQHKIDIRYTQSTQHLTIKLSSWRFTLYSLRSDIHNIYMPGQTSESITFVTYSALSTRSCQYWPSRKTRSGPVFAYNLMKFRVMLKSNLDSSSVADQPTSAMGRSSVRFKYGVITCRYRHRFTTLFNCLTCSGSAQGW